MLPSQATASQYDHFPRAIALDTRLPPLDLAQVWPRLKAGSLRVVRHFTTEQQLHLELDEAVPIVSELPPWRAVDRGADDVELLERVLLGESQKGLAFDYGISRSAISQRTKRALFKLGVQSTTSAIPAALVMLAQLSNQRCRLHGQLLSSRQRGAALHYIVLPRPELFVTALTNAERHVASMLVEGLSATEIARRRASAKRTIANQIAEIYRKLAVSRRICLIGRLLALAP